MENLKKIFANNEYCIEIKYPKSSTLFIEGSPIAGMYYLKKGKVKLSNFEHEGREIIVKLIGPEELIGHRCFFTKKSYGFNATMLEDSEVYFIDKKNITELLAREPILLESFILLLGRELEEADHRAENLITKKVGERLAEFLLNFVMNCKSGDDMVSEFNLSREEIASIIGTSSETVTRYISSFKEKGYLKETNKVLEIKEPEKLKHFSCHSL
jgi:CRP-like cAMP-binding protein